MRLWHQTLIPQLPRAQLLGQHRECAALRGNGWGRPHATVNYVFTHSPYLLYAYHVLIMDEMQRRGYRPDPAWHDKTIAATLARRMPIWRKNLSAARFMPNTMMITLPNAWQICAVKVLKCKDRQ